MESCSDSVFLQRCKVVGLGFCRRDISDRLEQTAVIEPVDPFQRGVLDSIHGFPRAFPPDDFGLVESIDGFGEGIVITVTDATDRWLEACFCQTLGIPYADILAASDQSDEQGHFQSRAAGHAGPVRGHRARSPHVLCG